MKKNNYLEHVNEYFSKNQTGLNDVLDNINSYRNITGYEEIKDSTHRAFNACVTAVKYFDKYNINYVDEIKINHEKIVMEAWEKYVMSIYKESINEMVELRNFINTKSDSIVKTITFKTRHQQIKVYDKLININLYMMGILTPLIKSLPTLKKVSYFPEFKDGRKHVKNYNDICDRMSTIDPETDLLEALKYYLKLFSDYARSQNYTDDIEINIKRQIDQIDYIYKCMIMVLYKLNRPDDIIKLSEFYLNIVKDELLEQKELIEKKYKEIKDENNKHKSKQLKK